MSQLDQIKKIIVENPELIEKFLQVSSSGKEIADLLRRTDFTEVETNDTIQNLVEDVKKVVWEKRINLDFNAVESNEDCAVSSELIAYLSSKNLGIMLTKLYWPDAEQQFQEWKIERKTEELYEKEIFDTINAFMGFLVTSESKCTALSDVRESLDNLRKWNVFDWKTDIEKSVIKENKQRLYSNLCSKIADKMYKLACEYKDFWEQLVQKQKELSEWKITSVLFKNNWLTLEKLNSISQPIFERLISLIFQGAGKKDLISRIHKMPFQDDYYIQHKYNKTGLRAIDEWPWYDELYHRDDLWLFHSVSTGVRYKQETNEWPFFVSDGHLIWWWKTFPMIKNFSLLLDSKIYLVDDVGEQKIFYYQYKTGEVFFWPSDVCDVLEDWELSLTIFHNSFPWFYVAWEDSKYIIYLYDGELVVLDTQYKAWEISSVGMETGKIIPKQSSGVWVWLDNNSTLEEIWSDQWSKKRFSWLRGLFSHMYKN